MTTRLDDELESIQIGDIRLDNRCKAIYKSFSDNPCRSINAACGGWKEVKAAYRFFDNDKVTPEKILQPHTKSTIDRISKEKIVLCLQDTSIIDYSKRRPIEGLGHIRGETDQGFLMHPTIAINDSGLPLGMLKKAMWVRESIQGQKERDKNRSKPIEGKESMRWIDSYRYCDELAASYPDVKFINITDREGDFLELLKEYKEGVSKAHLIVRAKADRLLASETKEDELPKKLWNTMRVQNSISTVQFELKNIDEPRKKNLTSKEARQKRTITQEIRVKRVTLGKSRPTKTEGKLGGLEITAILCTEINPPANEKPVEWLILTSLRLDNDMTAEKILKYYLYRWQIESFFKILKSGCKIEELQFDSYKRLQLSITMYCVVAWRVFYITWIARTCPELSSDLVFAEVEWKAAYMIGTRQKPPASPPNMSEIVALVAGFGGFLGRKNDKQPGAKSLWIGLQRLKDFALCYEIFNAK